MSSPHTCGNGRSLVIVCGDNIIQDIDTAGIIPCVVLVTAWTIEAASLSAWELLIKRLIEKGCRYFVCSGLYAEELHDLIDEIIVYEERREIDVVTTFHEDETPEEVVNFFVNTTDVWEKKHGGLVAILDVTSPEDRLIKEFLMQS
jgi:diadenosine tetraphosphatase ApaH/serine/threonine PP2A family protein phosphatase